MKSHMGCLCESCPALSVMPAKLLTLRLPSAHHIAPRRLLRYVILYDMYDMYDVLYDTLLVTIHAGGYYVNAGNVPRVLKWLPKASLIKQVRLGMVWVSFVKRHW